MIISITSPGERGGSSLAPLLSPELPSSLRFWAKPIPRRNLVASCQDAPDPLWLLVHPQPCCGEAKVPPINCVQLEKAHFGQSPGSCVYADL